MVGYTLSVEISCSHWLLDSATSFEEAKKEKALGREFKREVWRHGTVISNPIVDRTR